MERYSTARQATDDNLIHRIQFARSITKATDTHSEYVILIAFPLQQWLRECASILLRYYVRLPTCLMLNLVVLIVTKRLLRVNHQLHGCLIKRCNFHCIDFKNCIIRCSMEVQAFCFSPLFVIVMRCCAHCISHLFIRYVVQSPL